jgi:two-component system LytT family response regulator
MTPRFPEPTRRPNLSPRQPTVPISVVVADDEALARRRIVRMLQEERDVEIVAQCADGRQAVDAIRQFQPDLVFLDVQMPELDGFGVLASLNEGRVPTVIFVTAYDEYALRAFEVHALDYLLKPFDADRFRSAFHRARAQLELAGAESENRRLFELLEHLSGSTAAADPAAAGQRSSANALNGGQYADRLMIKTEGRVVFAKATEIDWIEAAGNYVRLHIGRDARLLRETMADLERRLDPARFIRIHRSTIVNLDRVREMQPWFSGEYTVIMHDGAKLKLSRGYRERLEERLGKPL